MIALVVKSSTVEAETVCLLHSLFHHPAPILGPVLHAPRQLPHVTMQRRQSARVRHPPLTKAASKRLTKHRENGSPQRDSGLWTLKKTSRFRSSAYGLMAVSTLPTTVCPSPGYGLL